ncbi:hypothetical protein HZ993_06265 [Rhodoferax sp. AJA081-3]|uniref:hypothetical protein n=1 Tax=Rhodoferax sp. AJA081-3 TaxID=2752316 RepID=UPI001ADF4431|nr:hypothetical protein [Rhodoferax sp. AJA081-3]QTN29422.1 hypothetical protein HZ993_06265 [Rhodoferax sp. AJA081-3]
MSALVIKSWKADSKPIDEKNNYVSITGRESGLVAWILSLMGVDPVTTIRVGMDRVEFSSSSLAGTQSRLIPLQSVCSTYYGYHKPWKAAVGIVAFFLFIGTSFASDAARTGAVGNGASIFLGAGAVGFVFALGYYFLNRTLTLGFVEGSGHVSGIKFKRSVIENIDVNEAQAKAVCTMVQRLIEAKERRGRQPATGQ